MPDTVADVGEFGLIDAMTARLPQGAGVVLGPGDDAAVIAAPDGRTVVTTDMLVEGRHFRRDWSSAHDIGRRAAAQNLSDVVAMGARPTAVTVALGVPRDLDVAWVLEMTDGLREECDRAAASVIGGDTVGSDVIILSVTALGDLGGRKPVRRSGARPGDVLAVCGRLGWAEAGLSILSRGLLGVTTEAQGDPFARAGEGRAPGVEGRSDQADCSPRVLVEAHRCPEVPYDAGPEAADVGATAMCDVSDGLLADARHIAEASGARVDIQTAALEVPDAMREVSSALGADPLHWVLTGGDDNALLAAFPPEVQLPDRWRVIGTVQEGAGVHVDGEPYDAPGGHTHFA